MADKLVPFVKKGIADARNYGLITEIHRFKIKLKADGANQVYSNGEKGRNSKFKHQTEVNIVIFDLSLMTTKSLSEHYMTRKKPW